MNAHSQCPEKLEVLEKFILMKIYKNGPRLILRARVNVLIAFI